MRSYRASRAKPPVVGVPRQLNTRCLDSRYPARRTLHLSSDLSTHDILLGDLLVVTWGTFVLCYLAITVFALLLHRRFARDQVALITRTVLFMIVTGFLFDYIANHRHLWHFPKLWGMFLALNPIENSLLMVSVTLHIVLLNHWARRLLDERSPQLTTQAKQGVQVRNEGRSPTRQAPLS